MFTSQQPHGQGHETTLAQLAADELGRRPSTRVRVVHGDTDVTPFNLVGTGGSRAATLASGAVIGAARAVRERVLDLASKLWEIEPADLELIDGRSRPGRAVAAMPLAQLALLAYVAARPAPRQRSPGVEAEYAYLSGEGTWSQSTHCCVVEVDVDDRARADRPLRRGRGLRAR